MDALRLAIIGCGAVTEEGYLPAARSLPNAEVRWLVDPDRERAERLARRFGVPHAGSEHDEAMADVDAAIVATPPDSHARLAVAFLRQGVHVLCEKPIAHTSGDAWAVVEAARVHQRHCAAVQNRRFLAWARTAREVLARGWIGEVRRFRITEGHRLSWPARSAYRARPRGEGGGLLWDWGPHFIDLLTWFLGPLAVKSFATDSAGGADANVWIELSFDAPQSGTGSGTVELSATRKLENAWCLEGSQGTLVIRPDRGEVSLLPSGGAADALDLTLVLGDDSPRTWPEQMAAQLASFVDAIQAGRRPDVTADEAVTVVETIEACLEKHEVRRQPWESLHLPSAPSGAPENAPTVLVTGATGFIGGRLAERLALEGRYRVRALTRSLGGAGLARLARLPVEIVAGDLRDPRAVQQAVDGCDYVIHCAVGGGRGRAELMESTVKGTEHLLQAARRAKVARLVHLSSAVVHGRSPAAPVVDEGFPLRSDGDPYADAKIAAEEHVWKFAEQSLPVVVFRPYIVYGPHAGWSVLPLRLIREGATLVEDGLGIANIIYVDNLVDALILSLDRDEAVGQSFIGVDDDLVTWKDYYGLYVSLLPEAPPLEGMSLEEWHDRERRQKRRQRLRTAFFPFTVARRVAGHVATSKTLRSKIYRDLPWLGRAAEVSPDWMKKPFRRNVLTEGGSPSSPPAGGRLPERELMLLHTSSARFSNERMKRVLGWRPRVSFEDARPLLRAWFEFENPV